MSNEQSNFDKGRSFLLDEDEKNSGHQDIEHNGITYRVIPLNIEEQETAKEWASIRRPAGNGKVESVTVSDSRLAVAMVILGTVDPLAVDPKSGQTKAKHFFNKADLSALTKKRSHGFLARLIKAAIAVNSVEEVETAKGNSEGDLTSESSTA